MPCVTSSSRFIGIREKFVHGLSAHGRQSVQPRITAVGISKDSLRDKQAIFVLLHLLGQISTGPLQRDAHVQDGRFTKAIRDHDPAPYATLTL